MTDLIGPPPPPPAKCLIETRSILAIGLTILIAAAYVLPWVKGVPAGSEQYIGTLQGALTLQWGNTLSWYFGGSKTGAAAVASLADQNSKGA